MQKIIQPTIPPNWQAKKDIPLWVPHKIHKNKTKVGSKMLQQKVLR